LWEKRLRELGIERVELGKHEHLAVWVYSGIHRLPFPGDHGIQFEPDEDADSPAADAEHLQADEQDDERNRE
jgi:hypothetical protein